jgi:hypothetical protein
MDWQPVAPGQLAILDEQGVILRLIVDRGAGRGNERFIVSGKGHKEGQGEDYYASLDEAKSAGEATLET